MVGDYALPSQNVAGSMRSRLPAVRFRRLSGEPPLAIRARLVCDLYFPDPLGIVFAVNICIKCPAIRQGIFLFVGADSISARIKSGGI